MRTVILLSVLISFMSHTQNWLLAQDVAQYMYNKQNREYDHSTISMASSQLPSDQTREHFLGRYLMTLFTSSGVWTLSVVTASLIDNGTVKVPRNWFEDNALPIARPSVVLSSATVSMLLYKRTQLKAFLATTALSSALLLGTHVSGRLMSDEADALLQLTATFFLVPFTSTLYHHILSSKQESGPRTGKLELGLPVFWVKQVNRKVLPVLGFRLQW